ncbi:hypothetical protein TRFO_20047 [Tritrichomonas foetus]|uniref:Uncharacterized protein n=1 Tax=Tritrichomonas foetus TaxID=1144522 RepID=A0A1J4KI01_9EUKA|nr:hypothetical protein TRFO_20047 [Tritrichomonas foetus]|eukprot:OHT10560.1 hypothetical protein TRFO_20047 [Tritrichomonas foetus]
MLIKKVSKSIVLMSTKGELNELSNSSASEDEEAPAVPEIAFQPQLTPDASPAQMQPDENFRSKHPLFDAPELIDDHDELNAHEKLSSDDEADEGEQKDDLQSGKTDIHQSALVPQDADQDGDIPEWRKFSLPPTPEPDDTEIDAEIQEKFSIAKLLQQIRAA